MKSIVVRKQTLRDQMRFVYELVKTAIDGGDVLIELKRPRRSLSQNQKLWPMLRDISQQVEWHGMKLSEEDWKNLGTAALFGQKTVPGINGGCVVLGKASSKLNKSEFGDLIEILYSFGSEVNVKWSEPALEVYERYVA